MKRVRLSAPHFLAAFALSLAFLLAWLAPRPAHAADTVYSFGVVPQFEQRKLHATWKPIVDELARRTGLQFNLVTTLKIQDFEKAFFRGDFDFVYVNPYHLVDLHDKLAYIPLAADTVPLRGILVVRKDSPVKSPADLNGSTIAFPSPNALGASLLVRADLDQVHHVKFDPLYVTTHSSVYLHVVKDMAAAGGGVEKTLQEQDESIRSQLRVIFTSRACPSHPIAAHPRVSKEVREKVRRALLEMNQEASTLELLQKIPVKQLAPVSFDDYAAMQKWGLQKYWQPIEEGK